MFVSDGYSPTYFDDNGNGYLPEDLLVPCIGEAFSIPYLTIENYQNVDIVLPSELAKDGNDVGLGTTMFVVAPSDAELTTTVNFYDNTADTGGITSGVRGQPLPGWGLKPTVTTHTALKICSRATSIIQLVGRTLKQPSSGTRP